MLTLPAGTTLDDRYEILSVAGSGGMGTVYRAKQIGLGREVAVKVLDPALLGEGDNYERFEREAKSISLAQHEHIATFFNFGVLNNSMPYLAMEYLSGPSLRQIINDESPLPWQRAFQICAQICQGMGAAHQAGVVHRDLKPNNVILMDKPRADFVKIVDFGLAKLSTATSGNNKLTVTGQLIGSVNYLSPEQCLGRQSDERSDIYSLGCILYELLCGCPPFEHENPVAMLHAHMSETPIKPSKRIDTSKQSNDARASELNKQSTSGSMPGSGEISKQIKKKQLEKTWFSIDAIVSKAMAKDPANRYASMKEFEHDLGALLSGEQDTLVAHSGPALLESQTSDPKKNALAKAAGITAATIAIMGGALIGWLHLSDEGQEQRTRVALQGDLSTEQLADLLIKAQNLQTEGKLNLANQLKRSVELNLKRAKQDPLELGKVYLAASRKLLKDGKQKAAQQSAFDAIIATIHLDQKNQKIVNDTALAKQLKQALLAARQTNLEVDRAQIKELQFYLSALNSDIINHVNLSDLYDYIFQNRKASTPKELATLSLNRANALAHKGSMSENVIDEVIRSSKAAYGAKSTEAAHNAVSTLKITMDYPQQNPNIHAYVVQKTMDTVISCKGDDSERLNMLFDTAQIAFNLNQLKEASRGTDQIKQILAKSPEYGPEHAQLEMLLGRYEHARKNYQKSSDLLSSVLAYTYANHCRPYDLRLPVMEQASNLEKLGKPKEAIEVIQSHLKKTEEYIDSNPDLFNSGSTFYKDGLANSWLQTADFFSVHGHLELVLPAVKDSLRVCHKYDLEGVRTLWALRRLIIELDARREWKAAIPYIQEEVNIDDSFFDPVPETMTLLVKIAAYAKLQQLDPALFQQSTDKIVNIMSNAIHNKRTAGIELSSVIFHLARCNQKEDARKLLKEGLNKLQRNDPEYIALRKNLRALEAAVN